MELVETPFVSDFTKKTLAQFGWETGDAIPAELGAVMLKMKETLPPTDNTDVLIAKDALSAAQVAEIQNMLAQAKEVAAKRAKKAAHDEATKNFKPEVAEALEKFNKMREMRAGIIDDRDVEPPKADTKPQEKQQEKPQEKPTLSDVVAETSPAAAPQVIAFCPRCGWDMRLKFEVKPTDKDKEDFLVALLGGVRFKKTYELFGGKMLVTFRSMLAEENKLLYRQLTLDQQQQKITTEAEWFVQMMDYRLACSLETIRDQNGKVVFDVPELAGTDFVAGSNKTHLADQLALLNSSVLAQEVTRRLVGMHLRQFQRLVEALEAVAAEPSFWTGIA